MPNATMTATPAMKSARITRRRRVVPWVPNMSIAASRLTFTLAMVASSGDIRPVLDTLEHASNHRGMSIRSAVLRLILAIRRIPNS
jgi:hypothetical protein